MGASRSVTVWKIAGTTPMRMGPTARMIITPTLVSVCTGLTMPRLRCAINPTLQFLARRIALCDARELLTSARISATGPPVVSLTNTVLTARTGRLFLFVLDSTTPTPPRPPLASSHPPMALAPRPCPFSVEARRLLVRPLPRMLPPAHLLHPSLL